MTCPRPSLPDFGRLAPPVARTTTGDSTVPRSYEPYAEAGRPMWIIVRSDSLHDFSREERGRLERFLRERCRLAAEFEVDIDARNLDVEVWRFE